MPSFVLSLCLLLPRFPLARSPKRVEMGQRSKGYPGTADQNSLRAHRGLRAMIPSVFQAPVIIEPVKMAQSEESWGEKRLARWARWSRWGWKCCAMFVDVTIYKGWPPLYFHCAGCCHASRFAVLKR